MKKTGRPPKLTDAQCREIWAQVKHPRYGQKAMASRYQVSLKTIAVVVRRGMDVGAVRITRRPRKALTKRERWQQYRTMEHRA